jgi:hypothetical protein
VTAALSLNQRRPNRAEQLEHLRRKMAAVSGKVGGVRRGAASAVDRLSSTESLLPIPETLGDVLPAPLPRGTVAVLSGARSLSLSMVAAVTAEGGHAAIVGQPDAGLLAAAEMGADLSRIAVIPDPGSDPVEVAAVLMDGMDMVVLGLGGRSVPATRARAVVARARQKGCTLLVTNGDWQGASARLDARVCGYEITGRARPGSGRIAKVQLTHSVSGRAGLATVAQ